VNALITAGYRKARSDIVEAGNLHELPLLPPEGEACVRIHRDFSVHPRGSSALEFAGSALPVEKQALLSGWRA
jgi:hypothetical protein